MLAEALALMDTTGEALSRRRGASPSGRVATAAGVNRSRVHEAEACFHRALAIARRQQAKSLELRAVVSLTRLYQSQARQAESRSMLAECYDWFTEGFETPDLREAKALLEQIS